MALTATLLGLLGQEHGDSQNGSDLMGHSKEEKPLQEDLNSCDHDDRGSDIEFGSKKKEDSLIIDNSLKHLLNGTSDASCQKGNNDKSVDLGEWMILHEACVS